MRDTAVELLYRQTLVLIVEARDYEAATQSIPHAEAAQSLRHAVDLGTMSLALEAERLRVTTRLLEAMSWLMAQKGAAAGEISGQEASSRRFAPGSVAVCLGRPALDNMALPQQLASLLDRSLALYLEVSRAALDEPDADRRHS